MCSDQDRKVKSFLMGATPGVITGLVLLLFVIIEQLIQLIQILLPFIGCLCLETSHILFALKTEGKYENNNLLTLAISCFQSMICF